MIKGMNQNPVVELMRRYGYNNSQFCVAADMGHSSLYYLKRGVTKRLPAGVRCLVTVKGLDPAELEEGYREYRRNERERLLVGAPYSHSGAKTTGPVDCGDCVPGHPVPEKAQRRGHDAKTARRGHLGKKPACQ